MVSPNQQARGPGPRALTPLSLGARALCALLLSTEVDWVGSGATMAAYRQWYGVCETACGRGEGAMGRLEGKVALMSGGAPGPGATGTRPFPHEGTRLVVGDILDAAGEQAEGASAPRAGRRTTCILMCTAGR